MAAGLGNKIERADYNEIQSIIGPVLGTASSNPAPTVTAGSFIVGVLYRISSLGTTSQSQWNTIAGTSGVTYAVGSIFKAATVGVGSGQVREVTLNYGQTVLSSPVSTNALITNTQWANLRSDILRSRQHQTGTNLTAQLTVPYFEITITSTTAVTNVLTTTNTSQLVVGLPIKFAGTVIGGISGSATYYVAEILDTIQFKISNTKGGAVRSLTTGVGAMLGQFGGTSITEADRAAYKLMAQAAFTNRLAPLTDTEDSIATMYNDSYLNTWNGVLSVVHTIDFTSNDAARYFFNTGGRVEIVSERSGGSGGLKNATWTSMLSEISGMGRIIFNYNSTKNILTNGNAGSGVPAAGTGFYQLSSVNTQIFEKPAPSGAYADNIFYIYARLDDSPGSPGSKSRLTFTMEWRDESDNPNSLVYGSFGPFGTDENIDGIMSCITQVVHASGNNVSLPAPTAGIANNFTQVPIVQTNTSYSISGNTSVVNEGTLITYSISTTEVPNGTVVYWTNGGSTTAADFTDSVNSGSVTIGAAGTATLTRTVRNDLLTEGPETVQIVLRTTSTTGPAVATSQSIVVNDTSLTPIVYNISVSPSGTQPENTVLTYNVTLQNFGNGTLYWANTGTTTAADFADGLNVGSVPINNNTGSFTRTIKNDNLTEGTETVIMQLRVGSTGGTTVATAPTVTVTDSSTNILPTYTITTSLPPANPLNVNEDQQFEVYVATNSTVPSGLIYYRITGTGITASDLSLNSLNGSLNIVAGSTSTLSFAVRGDGTTEGPETLQLLFYTNSSGTLLLNNANTGGIVTGNNLSIRINDTSRTLVISPTSLSAGTTNSSYSANFTSANGDGFYTYSIISGTIAPNLSLSGSTLSGALETAGTYSFTIAVRDSSNKSGSRAYDHVINANEIVTGPTGTVKITDLWYYTISGGHANGGYRISTNGGASYGGTQSLNADGRAVVAATQPFVGTQTYTVRFTVSGNIRQITVTSRV
jgi:hypothetical protein